MSNRMYSAIERLAREEAQVKSLLRSPLTSSLREQIARCSLINLSSEIASYELPVIAFLGPFNSGKSTLINRLLGVDVLEVSNRPTTSAIVVFRHIRTKPLHWGPQPVHLLKPGSSIRTIDRAAVQRSCELCELAALSTYAEELVLNPQPVIVFLDSDALKSASLVDAPGTKTFKDIGSEEKNKRQATEMKAQRSLMGECDGFFILSNMQGGAFNDIATVELLEALLEGGFKDITPNVTFVGSNADPRRLETAPKERLERVRLDLWKVFETLPTHLRKSVQAHQILKRIAFSYVVSAYERESAIKEFRLLADSPEIAGGVEAIEKGVIERIYRRENITEVNDALGEMILEGRRICHRRVLDAVAKTMHSCEQIVGLEMKPVELAAEKVNNIDALSRSIERTDELFRHLSESVSAQIAERRSGVVERFLLDVNKICSYQNAKAIIDKYKGKTKAQAKQAILNDVRTQIVSDLTRSINLQRMECGSLASKELHSLLAKLNLAYEGLDASIEKTIIKGIKKTDVNVSKFSHYMPGKYSSGTWIVVAASLATSWFGDVSWGLGVFLILWLLWKSRVALGVSIAFQSEAFQRKKLVSESALKEFGEIDEGIRAIYAKSDKAARAQLQFMLSEAKANLKDYLDKRRILEAEIKIFRALIEFAARASDELKVVTNAKI